MVDEIRPPSSEALLVDGRAPAREIEGEVSSEEATRQS